MKVRPSVKKMCERCRIIKRQGVVRVICVIKKHKQRQKGLKKIRSKAYVPQTVTA